MMHYPTLARTGLALTLALAVAGCRERPPSDPIHLHLICAPGSQGAGEACEPAVRQGQFDAWFDDSLRRPGSSFTLWIVGRGRDAYRPAFTACIPDSWGGNVLAAKQRFVGHGRQSLSAPGDSQSQAGCRPPDADAPGGHRVRVLGAAQGLAESLATPAAPSPVPVHLGVVCDRSDSGLELSCDAAQLAAAFDRWLGDGGLWPESSFTVHQVGRSRDTTRRIFSLRVSRRARAQRTASLLGARGELPELFATGHTGASSAVAEALSVAAEELYQLPGRRRLLILSDFRQYSPGRWNFETGVPPASDFIRWLEREKLLVDLAGTEVVACGMHHRRAPGAAEYKAHLARATRDLWSDVLEAMGAAAAGPLTRCI